MFLNLNFPFHSVLYDIFFQDMIFFLYYLTFEFIFRTIKYLKATKKQSVFIKVDVNNFCFVFWLNILRLNGIITVNGISFKTDIITYGKEVLL